jgi:hypothetical protein
LKILTNTIITITITINPFIAKVSLSVGFGKSKWGAMENKKYYILIGTVKGEQYDMDIY